MASERLRRRRGRWALVAALAVLLSLAAAATPALTRLGIDLLLPAARAMTPQRPPAGVDLIVIDEVTHRAPPFSETPEVAWTPYLAEVLEAVDAAGPAVVGLDVIYPKTLAGPDLLPGFDRPFLQSLARLGREGRLVLSEVRLSGETITPYEGQRIAVGGARNIRPAHLTPDFDSVVRGHAALAPREDGSRVPSLAAELAARAGRPALGDFLIDFRRPAESFAAYRLSDLLACARAGRGDVFEAFAGRLVLVGVALDVEDRRLAANRFAPGKLPSIVETGCAPPRSTVQPELQTTPGVLIQAYALDTLLQGSAPRLLATPVAFASGVLLFGGLGLAFFRLPPPAGGAAALGAAGLLWLAGALALSRGLVLPWIAWAAGAGLLLAAVHGYRLVVEGAERRRIAHAFRHYLSPALVERLADDPDQLKLGGERRRVAVMFVDLAGFTAYSAAHADQPEHIVARLNALFTAIGDCVDAAGGYVDKFIGDAVMAVWGAPTAADRPEGAAAEAAMQVVGAVAALNAARPNDPPLRIRIGLAAGEVVAGNLGARQRYNYTVIGDAVNRAARLEEACKAYEAQVLADGAFAAALPSGFDLRPRGWAALRGLPDEIEVVEIGPVPPTA